MKISSKLKVAAASGKPVAFAPKFVPVIRQAPISMQRKMPVSIPQNVMKYVPQKVAAKHVPAFMPQKVAAKHVPAFTPQKVVAKHVPAFMPQKVVAKHVPAFTPQKIVAKHVPAFMPQKVAAKHAPVVKQNIVQKAQVPAFQKITGAKLAPVSTEPKTLQRNIAPSISKIVGEKQKTDFKIPQNRPAGKIVKQNGEIFVHGNDGWLYQYVEDKQMGEIGGFFKKIRRLAGKVVKGVARVARPVLQVAAPIARFIPPLAPYAFAISAGSFASGFLGKKKRRAAPQQQAQAIPEVQPVQATAPVSAQAPGMAPSTNASGGGGGTVPTSDYTKYFQDQTGQQNLTDQNAPTNLPASGVSKTMLYAGLGIAAYFLLTSKRKV